MEHILLLKSNEDHIKCITSDIFSLLNLKNVYDKK